MKQWWARITYVGLLLATAVFTTAHAEVQPYEMVLTSAHIIESSDNQHSIEIHAQCIENGCWADMDDVLYYDPDSGEENIDAAIDNYYVLDVDNKRLPRLTSAMDKTKVTVVLQLWVPDSTKRIGLGIVGEEESAAMPLETRK